MTASRPPHAPWDSSRAHDAPGAAQQAAPPGTLDAGAAVTGAGDAPTYGVSWLEQPPGSAQAGPPPAGPPPAPLPAGPDAAAAMPVVMHDVTKRFGDVVAIERISLAVPPGTILGMVGPSGSGKTTTIRTLTGALQPDTGLVRVLGEDPRHFHRKTRERIGYMPQLFVLYPDLTARENIEFVATLFGMLGRRRRDRVREVLDLVELTDARDRRASQLSGGMQRRLELACALVHEPTLIFLDEPTAGIDPILRQAVWTEFRRLRDAGRTLLVTTQYVGEAEYCDQVALIATGQLVAFATPDALRRQALGGEVLEIDTASAFDARVLPSLPGLVAIRQAGPTRLLVVAHDAGLANVAVVDAIQNAGGRVQSSREYRPSFDEVFTALVEQHLATVDTTQDGAAALATLNAR